MKKFLLGFLAIVLAFCAVGCSDGTQKSVSISFFPKNTTDPTSVQDEFYTVAETDSLLLRFNEKTTDIAVTDKSNGFIWSSANRAEGDKTTYNLFYLTYHTDAGNVGTLSTTFNCLSDGQYKFEKIENGIKISYSLGDVATEYIYPETLMPDRYEHFYKLADDDGKYLLEIVYSKIDISFYDDVTQAEMNKKYPYAKGGKLYVPSTVLNDALKMEISELFASLGYTKDDLATDHTSLSSDSADSVAVNMSVYYKLDKDCFYIEIPEKEIQYNSSVHVDSINVLESFSGQSMDDGYFLLPDGSGSIMKFRNGKTAKNYRVPIYGEDYAINAENKLFNLQNAALPVYGCVTGENGYFAVVEDGESHTYINATAGTDVFTPRAWVDFTVEPMDYMVAKNNTVTGADNKNSVYQEQRYDGSLKLKYRFLSGKKANYSTMANYYRHDLFGDTSAQIKDYPLTCEIVGAVDLSKTLFGFRYSDIAPLTDFEETLEIADDLINSNIDGLRLVLTGWNGIGLRNGYVGKYAPSKKLGGEKGLKNLISSLKSSVKVFLNGDVQYAGIKSKGKNAAYFLDESKAKRFSFDPAVFTRNQSNFSYIISPQTTVRAIKEIGELSNDYSCGLSLKTVGVDLNSDFNTKNTIDRQNAMRIYQKELASVSQKTDLMTSVGNAYVLPYIKHLTDIPVRSNGQDMTDESVPFLAMVLSGHIEYSAPPFNNGYSEKTDLLRILESGAGCSAVFTAKDTKSADLSGFDLPAATCYNDLKDSVLSSYAELKEALNGVYGKTIVSHTIHENGVREIVYENGIRFYLNYSSQPKEVNGIKIEALGFVKEEN